MGNKIRKLRDDVLEKLDDKKDTSKQQQPTNNDADAAADAGAEGGGGAAAASAADEGGATGGGGDAEKCVVDVNDVTIKPSNASGDIKPDVKVILSTELMALWPVYHELCFCARISHRNHQQKLTF